MPEQEKDTTRQKREAETARRQAEQRVLTEGGTQALHRYQEERRRHQTQQATEKARQEQDKGKPARRVSAGVTPDYVPPPRATPPARPHHAAPHPEEIAPPVKKHSFAPRGTYTRETPRVGGSPRYEGFGANIQAIEDLLGMLGGITEYRLGKLLGVPHVSNTYQWRKGLARPSASCWVKIFKLLKLHIEDGLDLKDKTTGVSWIDWSEGEVHFKDGHSASHFAKSRANGWEPGQPNPYAIYASEELRAKMKNPASPEGEL